MLSASVSVYNRVTLGITTIPGQDSCSGEVGQQIMDSIFFVCVFICSILLCFVDVIFFLFLFPFWGDVVVCFQGFVVLSFCLIFVKEVEVGWEGRGLHLEGTKGGEE